MTGSGLGVTARDREILEQVQRFGVLTRDHLIALRLFSSKTRAKERLKRLVDAGYLAARPQSLPTGGPRLVYSTVRVIDGSDSRSRKRLQEASDLFLSHELGLVDVHIAFDSWTTIRRFLLAKDLESLNLGLIPDAYAEYDIDDLTYCTFVEYDRGTETVSKFERKVRTYVEMARTGRFQQVFHRKFFRVCILTDTRGRLKSLATATARQTDKVFRFTTLSQLIHQGPLASIWWRPGAQSPESLMGS
jgi:hypothetical protein